jgi:hypothetical protein
MICMPLPEHLHHEFFDRELVRTSKCDPCPEIYETYEWGSDLPYTSMSRRRIERNLQLRPRQEGAISSWQWLRSGASSERQLVQSCKAFPNRSLGPSFSREVMIYVNAWCCSKSEPPSAQRFFREYWEPQ